MKPAAPVTSRFTSGVLLAPGPSFANLASAALDLLGPVEQRERLLAAALFDERACEVVVRIGFIQLAAAVQLAHCLTRDGFGPCPPTLPEERRRLVGELLAASARGRRRWRRGRRSRRR